ncbi:MAG TPA: hypothetical protein VII06_41200 [Chloroflexota bacterium]|jgi:hypothetical protein
MPRQPGTRARIGIVGGSRVVGEALELLLQGLGYQARFVAALPQDGARPLADSQLVVLAPGLSPTERAAILAGLRETLSNSVPVLELTRGRAAPSDERTIHWPCRAGALARVIDTVLHAPAGVGS